MDYIELNFSGPYTFYPGKRSIFDCEYSDRGGIYLWTMLSDQKESYYIHYVGETTAFSKRQKEHLIRILGMDYRIIDPNKAKKGIEEIVWNGLWRDKDNTLIRDVFDTYVQDSSHVIEYIKSIAVFFAPIETSNELRKHIEGSIGWNLRNNHPKERVLYPNDNKVGTRKPVGKILRISVDKTILGIDPEIAI